MLVEPYNPDWPRRFERLRLFYAGILGNLAVDIHHVGSTAVPGATAKPIVDIDIAIRPSTFDDVRHRLVLEAGLEHEGDLGIPGRDAFQPAAPSLQDLPDHHPYVCPVSGHELGRHLLFRDFLRRRPDLVRQLNGLKVSLCERHGGDRQAYMSGKAPFCAEIRRLALLDLSPTYCPPTLGLRRGTVSLVPNDREWGRVYEAESQMLRYHVGHLVDDIQHVGSTSVPGLRAKPILDIAIAVPARDRLPELRERMVAVGYIDRGDGGENGGWLLVREGDPDVRYVHAHVVASDDPQWRFHYIGFRDRLRSDSAARMAYERLKEQNARAYRGDRKAYTAAKVDFVRGVIGEIEAQEAGG